MKNISFAEQAKNGEGAAGTILQMTAAAGSVTIPAAVLRLSAGESFVFSLAVPDCGGTLEIEELHQRNQGVFSYALSVSENGKPEKMLYFRDYEPCADTWNGYYVNLSALRGNLFFRITAEYGTVYLHAAWLHENIAPEPPEEKMLAGFFTPRLDVNAPEKTIAEMKRLRDTVTEQSHMRTAISFEIPYMNRSDREIADLYRAWLAAASDAGVPVIINLNTWWGGTPGGPDGNGGLFSDSEYQQVVFDPADGKYAASVPNMWNNTPWLTMNHPRLNHTRCARLGVVIRLLQRVTAMESRRKKIPFIGMFLDNEPAYWAAFAYGGDADAGGDFSSFVRADAAADGVSFPEGKPLGKEQRVWLLANMNRYISALGSVCDAQRAAEPVIVSDGAAAELSEQVTGHIYTHVFPFACYPFMNPDHPQWETHITPFTRLGIESSTVEDSRIFDYAVRLGFFGNINAERACMRNYDFFLQDYLYGADICMIFNYRSEDAAAVDAIGKSFTTKEIPVRDFPIPVRCFDVFCSGIDFPEITQTENIAVCNYRNRRVWRPEKEGTGSLLICAGKAKEYGETLVAELWAFSHKENGAIHLSVGKSSDCFIETICLPEHGNEGSPLMAELPLKDFSPDDTVWVKVAITSECFDADWCMLNYIWRMRLMRRHSRPAGQTDGFCFTAAQLRRLHRITEQRAENVRNLTKNSGRNFLVTNYGTLGESGFYCNTQQPVFLETEPTEDGMRLTAYGKAGIVFTIKNAFAEKKGFNCWEIRRAADDVRLVTERPDFPTEIIGRYEGVRGGILKISNDAIAERGWQPVEELPIRGDTVFRLRYGEKQPFTETVPTAVPKGTDGVVYCDKTGVSCADFTVFTCTGTVVSAVPVGVYPKESNAKITVQNQDGLFQFTIGRACKLGYPGAPHVSISGCPGGDPGLYIGMTVSVRYASGNNTALRALEINPSQGGENHV